MGNNNARRFSTDHTSLPPSSGESPVHRGILDAPATSPPGRSSSNLIRVARPQDLRFLSSLQKKFSNELGFLPTQALQWYVDNQRVGIVTENGDPAGYVLGRTHFRFQPLLRPITQTAVAMDAQRRHLGMALVERVVKHAVDARQLAVQAICADGLDANDFWLALNFECVGVLPADNERGRQLIVWRRRTTSTVPDWFHTLPPAAGHRARRKRK